MLWQRRQRSDDMEIASKLGTDPAGGTAKKKSSRATAKQTSLVGGVSVSPMPLTAGEKVTVESNGLLASSGADQVYLHAGFGHGDWRDVRDIPMESAKPGVWKAVVPLDPSEDSRLNFCFKDRAGNWDNNYGLNWSLEIHNGHVPRF